MGRLYQAAEKGNLKAVKKLLEAGANVDKATKNSRTTALMCAAYHGHSGVVELLLGRGADVDKANNDGKTALIVAAKKGNLKAVKKLLEAGANVDKVDKNGKTALKLAEENFCKEIVDLLGKKASRKRTASAAADTTSLSPDEKEAVLFLLGMGKSTETRKKPKASINQL